MNNRQFGPLFDMLLNEADPVQYAASEYRCASLYLNDLGVPWTEAGLPLSLVGRIKALMNMAAHDMERSIPRLTIAIDFDDTFTADVETWTRVIAELQRGGHRVVCVSARRNEIGHWQELTRALPDGVTVLLSYDTPKRLYAKSQGVDVDIWIDDMPESIPTTQDILAMCG